MKNLFTKKNCLLKTKTYGSFFAFPKTNSLFWFKYFSTESTEQERKQKKTVTDVLEKKKVLSWKEYENLQKKPIQREEV